MREWSRCNGIVGADGAASGQKISSRSAADQSETVHVPPCSREKLVVVLKLHLFFLIMTGGGQGALALWAAAICP
ncbi:uncharacterized [Tachysurus ichikawai]